MWRRQRRVRDREPSLAPPGREHRRDGASRLPSRAAAVAAKANVEAEEAKRAEVEERKQRGIRPMQPSYHDTPLLSVGKEVRVQSSDCCRRALIECVNESDGTVDVMYYGLGDGQGATKEEEEATVPGSAVRPLEDFELQPESARQQAFVEDLYGSIEAAKEDANVLFKLKDYAAAAQLYGSAIDAMRHFRLPEPGSECWVLMNHGGALVLGAVRSTDETTQKAEVSLYRPDVDQLQVYRGAPWRVLIPVHEEHLALHSSLYSNRAKSLVQLGLHQEAAQDLTVTIGLWAARDEGARRGGGRMARPLTDAEVAEQREQLTRAYYLRARTRLARSKLAPARNDLAEALALQPPPALESLLRQLERDLELAQREQARSNRRLAKEVAKWADQAMSGLDAQALAALESGNGGAFLPGKDWDDNAEAEDSYIVSI